ncbi:MAG: adenosylcobinamide-phosphate synthase CbiB [Rikenellaceae bacterium]|nr:adenosylcobinamide-phosphate synthase CbiB [Rikenellaceae bacterium]
MDVQLIVLFVLPLLIGWSADKLLGDPPSWPHLIVGYGKLVHWGEKRLNRGMYRRAKGAVWSMLLIGGTFTLIGLCMKYLAQIHPGLSVLLGSIVVFYCLAGKTLIDEVRQVFVAVEESTEAGRAQLSRIVGRDTSALDNNQIRTAALETLSENLSDGVIAPLFWYLVLGVPGIAAYKMVNTLDSMIGYKSERYRLFGTWAARIDDVFNYIPARLTAALMVCCAGKPSLFSFLRRYGRNHSSPNSGYPEAALAGILGCRFGGPSVYHGQRVEKPWIGECCRDITFNDLRIAVRINRRVEISFIILILFLFTGVCFLL